MSIRTMKELDIKGKTILIRVDLNVPMHAGKILNLDRVKAILPTVSYALANHAAVILISHLGRPIPGKNMPEFSLKPLAECLSTLLSRPVAFQTDWLDGVSVRPDEIVLCENVRFLEGEETNDPVLSQKMAKLCDIFIMDAFATAHRAHASTVGVINYAHLSAAGLLLSQELDNLNKIMRNAKHPLVAVVGGAKVSSKMPLLKSLLTKADTLIVGGGIANTFLVAQGRFVGDSLYEAEFVESAKALLQEAEKQHKKIIVPQDAVVATDISESAKTQIKPVTALEVHDKILDVGPKTSEEYTDILKKAKTILWNGPVGVFEYAPFSKGTESLALAIANSDAFSAAGGGETLAAIEKFGVEKGIDYISTGGGAFLEYLEGKSLPGIVALEKKSIDKKSL